MTISTQDYWMLSYTLKGGGTDQAIFQGKPEQKGATYTGRSPFGIRLKISEGGRLNDGTIATKLELTSLGSLKPPKHKLGDLFCFEEEDVRINRQVNDVTYLGGAWHYDCEWETPPDDSQPASLRYIVRYKESELTPKRKVRR